MESVCEYHDRLLRSQLATGQARSRLVPLLSEHQEISRKHARILLLQRCVGVLKKAREEKENKLVKVQQELEALRRSNDRREVRLRRARGRDFIGKIQSAKKEYFRKEAVLQREMEELVSLRKQLVRRTVHWVFPLSLHHQEHTDVQTDNPAVLGSSGGEGGEEVDGEWVLSGVTTPPSIPPAHICCGFLPASGNMSEYINIVKRRKKEAEELAEHLDDGSPPHPLSDLYLAVPAAMTSIVHCGTLLANLLDSPLPYPTVLSHALCEYGRTDRRLRSVLASLAKLNDNVMFLCFSQLVPVERLHVGRVLDNLQRLVDHENLGRGGPFTCHPELLSHSLLISQTPCKGNPSSADWDNAPPLLHTADEDRLPLDTTGSDSEEEDVTGESNVLDDVMEEWEEVEDIIRMPSLGLGSRLEYGQVYRDYEGGRGQHSSQWREGEETVQSSSGLLEALGSLLGSGFRNKGF